VVDLRILGKVRAFAHRVAGPVVEPAIDDILEQYMFESLLGAVRFLPNFCKFRPPGVHELGKTQPLLGAKYDCSRGDHSNHF